MPADGENESAKPSEKKGFDRIFLSYARGDDEPGQPFVRRLHADLTQAGFDVWFDRVSMPARSLTFHQEIRDAIATRERLILVVGPKAIVSDYVTQEWQFAYFAANKCVNPIVRLDSRDSQGNKVDGYALIPEDLKLLHAEDFRRDAEYGDHLKNLIRQLSETLPPVGKLVAVPELPPGYRAQPERLKALREMLLPDLQKPVVVTGESDCKAWAHLQQNGCRKILAGSRNKGTQMRSPPHALMGNRRRWQQSLANLTTALINLQSQASREPQICVTITEKSLLYQRVNSMATHCCSTLAQALMQTFGF